LLLFFAFVAFASAAPVVNKGESNCIIKYLKSVNQLAANFPEYPASGNAIETCDDHLKETKKAIYENVALELRNDDEMRPYMHCVMEKLRADKWSDVILKLVVYEEAADLNIENHEAKAAELDEIFVTGTAETLKNCMFEKEFGKIFDKMINSSSSEEEEDLESDYCLRKYATDNNLIDPSYNLVLNPKNIDVTAINCTPIVQKAIKETEDEFIKTFREEKDLSDAKVDCIVAKYRQEKFSDRLLSIAALSEVEITDEQKAAERVKFVKFMADVTESVHACV